MKRFFSVMVVFLIIFTCCSCAGGGKPEDTTADDSLNYPPILGVHIRNGDLAGFYALTKSGSYSWTDSEGNKILTDGNFCLDEENICTFNREDAGESIELRFTGEVVGYKIYSTEKSGSDIEDKSGIINEKYLVSENTPVITFPKTGEYYYVVDVNYAQGSISYGFVLE